VSGELIQTEHGLARDIGSVDAMALCHPRRVMHARGLCEACANTYDMLFMGGTELTPREKAKALMANLDFVSGLAAAARTMQAQMEDFSQVARHLMEINLPMYATLHMKAAEVAAEEGDARPSQWALERLKPGGKQTVEPEQKAPSTSPNLGVQVVIGVPLGNAPREAVSATVVELPAKENG
jgi:hypothetical protein